MKIERRLLNCSHRVVARFISGSKQTTVDIDDHYFYHTSSIPLPITSTLNILDPNLNPKLPVYRVMNPSGILLDQSLSNSFNSKDWCLRMYQIMVRIQSLDDVFYNAQRQGRISFYMQSAGEEAIHIGINKFCSIAMLN